MSATRQPRAVLAAVLVLLQAQPSTSIRRGDLFGLRRRERQLHWHHDWEEGMRHSLRWYKADWVASITDFFCDPSCQERIKRAPSKKGRVQFEELTAAYTLLLETKRESGLLFDAEKVLRLHSTCGRGMCAQLLHTLLISRNSLHMCGNLIAREKDQLANLSTSLQSAMDEYMVSALASGEPAR